MVKDVTHLRVDLPEHLRFALQQLQPLSVSRGCGHLKWALEKLTEAYEKMRSSEDVMVQTWPSAGRYCGAQRHGAQPAAQRGCNAQGLPFFSS